VSKKDLAALIGKSIEAIRLREKKRKTLGRFDWFGKSIEAIRLREKKRKTSMRVFS